MIFRRFLSAVALCALTASASAQDATDLHIGILAPLSGPFEPLGRQVERGVALATEGLDGVTVTAVDDGCDEEQGRDAANQLVGAQVNVVVGGVCWRPANAARDVFAFANIPFVASGVRYETFTDDADGLIYRLNGRDDGQAQVLAAAILDGTMDGLVGGPAHNRPLVLFYTDGNYGRTLAEGVQEALNADDVDLALYEAFTGEGDMASLAERAEAEGAGLVMILAGQADSAVLADAIAQRLPDVPVLAGDSVMTGEFRLMAGEGSNGVVFARPTSWRALLDEDALAQIEGDTPGSAAGLVLPSMAATQVALRLLEEVEGPFETVLGDIAFDANGDADVPDFQLWQWRDGRIWPLEAPVVPSQPDEG
ncbi:MAG: branched-chain amino acid ABC transporter substrate-binding protein [Devosiaceae bacterium]